MANSMTTMLRVVALIMWVSITLPESAESKEIMVGGKEGWHFGFNYTQWASTVGQVCVGDVLVFKYTAPQEGNMHNVVLFKNRKSYNSCNFTDVRMLGGPVSGGGQRGFRFLLRNPHRYFFSCSMGDGFHCQDGLMRFGVHPIKVCT